MGIVIPFEVVRQDKPDNEAELRIQEKEAIYRRLIEKEAVREGLSFEEMEAKTRADDEEIEEGLRRDGLGYTSYENKLDREIASLRYVVEVFAPLLPEGAKLS